MAGKAALPFLIGLMLLTGVCNTLLTKYQDMQCVGNCTSPDPRRRRHFEQPVIQTAQMFIGEMGCWLVVGGSMLYERYFGKDGGSSGGRRQRKRRTTASDGYRRVAGGVEEEETEEGRGRREPEADDQDDDDDDAETSEDSPIIKPLVTNHQHTTEGHAPLKGWTTLVLAIPACCDIAGTTLMNVGLLFVAASIYQMTRGALVLFTGLLSVLFLRRHLAAYKWFGLVVVVVGVAIVGLAGAIYKDRKAVPSLAMADVGLHEEIKAQLRNALLVVRGSGVDLDGANPPLAVQTIVGVLLIACAQIFTATQFVVEERIMERYSIGPLDMVGWEGLFGFSVTAVGMVILHYAVGRTDAGRYGYFDMTEGLRELTQYRAIWVSSIAIMISIGGFNFFGLSVTRRLSATPRATIDTCRTLFIWLVSLGLGWETFKWLQVIGFVLLVYGTFLVNDIVTPPFRKYLGRPRGREELLPEVPIEHN